MRFLINIRNGLPARALPLCLMAGAVLTLAACNTVGGMGTDVSKAGQAVTNTSDKVKDKM